MNSDASDASIERIGLIVADYARALRFFTRMLGLKTEWENAAEKSAGLRVGKTLLMLQEGKTGSTGGGARIYFTITNIAQERDTLIENGVACSQVKVLAEYKIVDFSDPDGNRFGLIEYAHRASEQDL